MNRRFIKGLSLEGALVAVSRTTCRNVLCPFFFFFFRPCPPVARATAASVLLGGPGHRLLSAQLSAASLTDTARGEGGPTSFVAPLQNSKKESGWKDRDGKKKNI